MLQAWAGSAGEFHAADLLAATNEPTVFLAAVAEPALVLGSAQSLGAADADACRRHGVEIVVRRSGGGAVLVEPGALEWFDVIVPESALAALPGFERSRFADVVGSMTWIGERIAAALDDLGAAPTVGGVAVYDGKLEVSPLTRAVCFAGLGAGEVVAGPERHKLVGISQRRTRNGARFQCAVHVRWNPTLTVELLADDLGVTVEALPAVAELDPVVAAELPAALATQLRAA